MSQNLSLLLALLLVLAVGGGTALWRACWLEEPGTARGTEEPAAALPGSAGGAVEPLVEPVLRLAEGGADLASPTTRATAIDLDRASWVEGRMRLPAGTPEDEEVRVVALGLAHDDPRVQAFRDGDREFFTGEMEHERWDGTIVDVDPAGRFRAPFAAGSALGFVWLEAHYLHLDRPVELGLPSQQALLLEPKLGGRVTGRFRLPSLVPKGSAIVILEPFEVQVLGWSMTGGRGNHRTVGRVGNDLSFDIGGLPADLSYFLRADPKVFAAFADSTLQVEAGEPTERTYLLSLGGRISGRVLDSTGIPLEGAYVVAEPEKAGMFFGGFGERSMTTGTDGRFDLRPVNGRFTVSATAEGYLEANSEQFEMGEGAWTNNLVLRLEPAKSLTATDAKADRKRGASLLSTPPRELAPRAGLAAHPRQNDAQMPQPRDTRGTGRTAGERAGCGPWGPELEQSKRGPPPALAPGASPSRRQRSDPTRVSQIDQMHIRPAAAMHR
jgi:hypothetical protein